MPTPSTGSCPSRAGRPAGGSARAGSKAIPRSASSGGRHRRTAPGLPLRTGSPPVAPRCRAAEEDAGKTLHESAARADEVLCLDVEDLHRGTSAGKPPPRAARPSGSTGGPAPPGSCPGSSSAVHAARCSSPTAGPRPARRRSTCARRPAGPGSPPPRRADLRGGHPAAGQPARLTRRHRGPGRLDAPQAPPQCPDARRRGRYVHPDAAGPLPPRLRPLPERYARPGVDAAARHVAERDPAARRRT